MAITRKKTTPRQVETKKTKIVEQTLTSSSSDKVFKKATLKAHQKPVANFLRENNVSILLGEAGCAKDFIQMFRALEGLDTGEFEKIVITKPIVEMGRSVGFMPGDENDKFAPYEKSFYNSISKILGRENINSIRNKIVFEHIGFQRGNTFPEHSVVILSEAQNMTLHELISYTTRLPISSLLFINADPLQSDIGKQSGLKNYLKIMNGIDGVGIMELDPKIHQTRHRMITDINKNYRKLLENIQH
jgi:phosphate starvation-inducible PhoH-like protein